MLDVNGQTDVTVQIFYIRTTHHAIVAGMQCMWVGIGRASDTACVPYHLIDHGMLHQEGPGDSYNNNNNNGTL